MKKLFLILLLAITAVFLFSSQIDISSYNNLTNKNNAVDNRVVFADTLKSCDDYKDIKQVKIKWSQAGPAICETASTDYNFKKRWNNFFSEPGEFILDLNQSTAGWPTALASDKPWKDPDFPPQDTTHPVSLVWEVKNAGPSEDFLINLVCFNSDVSDPTLLLSIASRTETEQAKQWIVEDENGQYSGYRTGSSQRFKYNIVKQNVKVTRYYSYFWGTTGDISSFFAGTASIRNANGYDYCGSQFCGLGWRPDTSSSLFPTAGMIFKYDEESRQNAPILHYCQGYGGEFSVPTGGGGQKNNLADTKLYLDPEYIEKTKKERGFRPTEPISPFDDVICELKVLKSEYPSKDSLNAELVTFDKNLRGTKISIGTLAYNPDSSDADEDYNYFEWKIRGWPDSLASGDIKTRADILEKMIENGNISCEAALSDGIKIGYQYPINLCVRLEGDKNRNTFGITTVRTKSVKLSPFDVMKKGLNDMKNGYQKIDPFKTFTNKFYFNIDLKNIGQSNWDMIKYLFLDMDSYSSCKGSRVYNIYDFEEDNGGTYLDARNVSLGTKIDAILPVHESGHAFCGLVDEYNTFRAVPNGINCFNLDQISIFSGYGKPYSVCDRSNNIRTSYCSIMGCGNEFDTIRGDHNMRPSKFNVWDCGVCLSKIDSKGTIAENAQYCKDSKLNIINADEKPSPTDNWECMESEDCIGIKNWDVGCNDGCINHKCVSKDNTEDCEIEVNGAGSLNLINGRWVLIKDIPGKCGPKGTRDEGRCVAIATKYSCIASTGECVLDAKGQFSNQSTCIIGCPKPK